MDTPVVTDPHRPAYHFLPPANWMNDPNGLIHWQGTYHLFYQHNPFEPVWGKIHWGHATSLDLVHWTHQPLALAPTPGGPDEGGCWSGCAVDDHGLPTLVYTGAHHGKQAQCLARSHDQLLTWVKEPANPVLADQPTGTIPGEFRDPFVWRDEAGWWMVLGTALETGHGAALLYHSDDLMAWTYLHPLLEGTEEAHGWMWECPNFVQIGQTYVLLFSNGLTRQVFYVTGTFEHHRFSPRVRGLLSADDFYAPLTMQDEAGRCIMVGWIDEPRDEGARRQAGWAGLASLPRVLSVNAQGQVCVVPVPEVSLLRREALPPGQPAGDGTLAGWFGDMLELRAEFSLPASGSCQLAVRVSPDGQEQTIISYERQHGILRVDRSRSSREISPPLPTHSIDVGERECLRLTIFLDRSVLEVFVEDGPCLSSRIYPSRPDSVGMTVSTGKGAQLVSLAGWALALSPDVSDELQFWHHGIN